MPLPESGPESRTGMLVLHAVLAAKQATANDELPTAETLNTALLLKAVCTTRTTDNSSRVAFTALIEAVRVNGTHTSAKHYWRTRPDSGPWTRRQ